MLSVSTSAVEVADHSATAGEPFDRGQSLANFSSFLDCLRIFAAITVLTVHLVGTSSPVAHQAVIVFFVLSGYVITWASTRDKSLTAYVINRLARIYSVVSRLWSWLPSFGW